MLPEKYTDNLERSARLRKFYKFLLSSTGFLSSIFVLGAIVHEFSHIYLLELYGCSYTAAWSVSNIGLSAGVQPLCSMVPVQLLAFYSIGYISVILSGVLLGVISLKIIDKRPLASAILGSSSIGFLLSVFSTIAMDGDIVSFMNVLGAPSMVLIPYLVTLTVSGIITKKVLDGHLER